MSREMTPAVEAGVEAPNVRHMLFVELVFDSGTVRVCAAPFNFDWDSVSWKGLGLLGDMGDVEESVEIGARGVELSLSGVSAEVAALALGEQYQSRPARIWFALLDDNHQVVTDPVLIFKGRIDDMSVVLGEQSSITVRLENRLADLYRPRVRRWNDADQRAEYPDDRGLEFVAGLSEQHLVWGPYASGFIAAPVPSTPSRAPR